MHDVSGRTLGSLAAGADTGGAGTAEEGAGTVGRVSRHQRLSPATRQQQRNQGEKPQQDDDDDIAAG